MSASSSAGPSSMTPYVLPFGVFLLLTELARWVPGGQLWIYPLKTVVAAGLMWWFRETYTELRWQWSTFGAVVGVGVLALWIVLTREPLLLTTLESVSPYELAGAWALPWIAIRLLGSSLVVPVMEELFWRSFVARYLINANFAHVPLGVFTASSLAIQTALFGVEHSQWVAGIVAGLAYSWVLYRTKSLSACIVAHAMTNFLLGVYVLMTASWQFW